MPVNGQVAKWESCTTREIVSVTPEQCRAARAALQIGVRELAAAKVLPNTITRFESGGGLYPRTIGALRETLEAAGVEFVGAEDGRVGILIPPTREHPSVPEMQQDEKAVEPDPDARARALLAYDLGWTRDAIAAFSGLTRDEVERLLGSEAASRAR